MDGVTRLAKQIKERDNPAQFTPMFGVIEELPTLKIFMGDRITLYADRVTALFDIWEKKYDSDGNFIGYVNLGKTVALLPYSNRQKYLALGVVVE